MPLPNALRSVHPQYWRVMMVEIERLREMARAALKAYEEETLVGQKPVYPQWAEDMLKVCDRAEMASCQLPATFAYSYLSQVHSEL